MAILFKIVSIQPRRFQIKCIQNKLTHKEYRASELYPHSTASFSHSNVCKQTDTWSC